MINSILLGVIGPWQIAIIAIVFILLFGGKKIPELMKGLGKGIKEFKDGMAGDEEIGDLQVFYSNVTQQKICKLFVNKDQFCRHFRNIHVF